MSYSRTEKDRILAQVRLNGWSLREAQVHTGVHYNTLQNWLREGAPSTNKQSVVLVIPDMHHPFCHPDALPFLMAVKARFLPSKFVCLGDEIDAYGFSKYPKDVNVMNAGKEMEEAIAALIPFYQEFPEMMVCVSNHTIRPHKRMKEAGIPDAWLPKYNTMLNAPDAWVWADHWEIDNVRYMHGDQGKGGKYGWVSNTEIYHQSVVVGHWHSKAGVVYDSAMFNMNAGCLIHRKAKAFDYAWDSHKAPNLGCGIVINGRAAHFIPMLTDEDDGWIGKL